MDKPILFRIDTESIGTLCNCSDDFVVASDSALINKVLEGRAEEELPSYLEWEIRDGFITISCWSSQYAEAGMTPEWQEWHEAKLHLRPSEDGQLWELYVLQSEGKPHLLETWASLTTAMKEAGSFALSPSTGGR